MLLNEQIGKMMHLMGVQNFTNLQEVVDHYTKQEIKRAYVSIRKKETTMQDLINHRLEGVVGVSTSKYNVSEWFVYRDIMLIMPWNAFHRINNLHQINYHNPEELLADDFGLFYRLYDRKGRDHYDKSHVVTSVGEKILAYTVKLEKFYRNVDENKSSQLYDINRFLNPHQTSKFYRYLTTVETHSVEDLTRHILDFCKIYDDGYYTSRPQTLTLEDLKSAVSKGVQWAGRIYADESEWLINDRVLNIPRGTSLFFVKHQWPKEYTENLMAEIEASDLKSYYKIHFVSSRDLSKYQEKKYNNKGTSYETNYEEQKKAVDQKKNQVLNNVFEELMNDMNTYLCGDGFKEWEPHFEYYVLDYDGDEPQRINEPFTSSADFQQKFQDVVAELKLSWLTYFPPEMPTTSIRKGHFTSFRYAAMDIIGDMSDKFGDQDSPMVGTTNYRAERYYDLYGILRRYMLEVYDETKEIVQFKEQMGTDMYDVYGKDIEI